jgi:tetratricopeptide (TPR) repeat protein
LDQLQVLITHSEDKIEKLSRCAIVGELYYHEKQFDSAWYYLSKVFRESQSVNSKKQAAEWLVEICENEEKYQEAEEYARFLVPFSTMNENQSHLKSQLTNIHQNYVQEKQEILHKKKIKKNHTIVNRVVGFLLGIVVVVVVLYVVNKKRHLRLQDRHEEMGRQLESERHAHKMKQAALAGRLKRSNETLRQTEQKLEDVKYSKNALADGKTLLANMVAFKASPVCRHILEVVEDRNFKPKIEYVIYKDYALDKSQLKALVEAADEHLDHFTVRIRKVYPALNEDDVKYCCLFLLGLNEADISALMQRAYSTVCERNRRIKRIMGTKGELKVALMEWV